MASTLLRTLKISTALVPATLLATLVAQANPQDGQVVQGTATITAPDPSTLNILQQTNKAIINWQSFDIGAGETTQFFLPSVSSVTLNRVVGGDHPSEILGILKSNGTVMVINPDGILFGPNSVVDVGGLLATTSDIEDNDFMVGNYRFSKPGNPSASIVNQGNITVKDEGVAALVAPGVRNEGIIAARLGKVTLGAANQFTLDLYGDDLINLALTDELTDEVFDLATGKPLADRVSNTGKISADGGTVVLKAATARKVVNSVINNTGVIEANSVGMKNGKIVLSAATAATKKLDAPVQKVTVSGTLTTSGTKSGETGGLMTLTGEQIELLEANLIASGDFGGGTVLVGGDYLGGKATDDVMAGYGISREAGTIETASTVTVDANSKIYADAKSSGKGGKVVVWADNHTDFTGSISSKGGASGGDGGFVEVSGHDTLSYGGFVDLSAYYGNAGTLLLDPLNVVIGGTGSSGLSVSSLANALLTSNVIVETGVTNEIVPDVGDIVVAESLSWSGNNTLSLRAFHNIIVNNGVTISNVGAGDLSLHPRAPSGSAIGTVSFLGTGKIDFSASTGAVSIFYDPTGAIKYQNPSDFTPWVITNPAVSNQLTSYMYVNDIYDLQNIQQNLSGNYALRTFVDASVTAGWNGGAGFTPIGNDSLPFLGEFYGNGVGITGLQINSAEQYVGLFGSNAGTIRDLYLAFSEVTGTSAFAEVGMLAGRNTGEILNILLAVDVSASGDSSYVGGIAGVNTGYIAGVRAGFLVGCQACAPDVVVAGDNIPGGAGFVGGLVGSNEGTIYRSSVEGVGVVAGGFGNDVGGLVGLNTGTVEQSFALGSTLGEAGGYAGGLVGWNHNGGLIKQSYSKGAVTSSTGDAGGLVGLLSMGGSVSQSYAIGPVNSGGGLVRTIGNGGGSVTNSYWDTESTGQTASAGGIGLTTTGLQAALPAGFDPATWSMLGLIDRGTSGGYPHLLWQVPESGPSTSIFQPPFFVVPPPPPAPEVDQSISNPETNRQAESDPKSFFIGPIQPTDEHGLNANVSQASKNYCKIATGSTCSDLVVKAIESGIKNWLISNIDVTGEEAFRMLFSNPGALLSDTERLRTFESALNDPKFMTQLSEKLATNFLKELGKDLAVALAKAIIIEQVASLLERKGLRDEAQSVRLWAGPALKIGGLILKALSANTGAKVVKLTGSAHFTAVLVWSKNAYDFVSIGIGLAKDERKGVSQKVVLKQLVEQQNSLVESLILDKKVGPAFPADQQNEDIDPELRDIIVARLNLMPELQGDLAFSTSYLSWLQATAKAVGSFVLNSNDAAEKVGGDNLRTGLPTWLLGQ